MSKVPSKTRSKSGPATRKNPTAVKCLTEKDLTDYPYALIVFKREKTKNGKLSIDYVPTNWLVFEKDCVKTKFPDPTFDDGTYNDDDSELLESFRKSCATPPEGWGTFAVEVRGRASEIL